MACHNLIKFSRGRQHTMKTPLEMRNEALETGTTVWQDGLTVLPEGDFILGGRRLTLNEAIMYSGNRRWCDHYSWR